MINAGTEKFSWYNNNGPGRYDYHGFMIIARPYLVVIISVPIMLYECKNTYINDNPGGHSLQVYT